MKKCCCSRANQSPCRPSFRYLVALHPHQAISVYLFLVGRGSIVHITMIGDWQADRGFLDVWTQLEPVEFVDALTNMGATSFAVIPIVESGNEYIADIVEMYFKKEDYNVRS